MKKLLWSSALVFWGLTPAMAADTYRSVINEQAGMFDIREVTIEKVQVNQMQLSTRVLRDYENDCSSRSSSFSGSDTVVNDVTPHFLSESQDTPPLDVSEGFSLDQIINIGKKIWSILEANKPVVTTQTFYAHALPRNVECWDQLENWHRPRSELYRAIYKNGFGMEVVKLEFRLQYAYGGQVDGLGNYISNATIQYGALDVFWGFKVDATVEVPMVVNVGKKDDPVAGMQMSVRWKVDGLNHLERTASFFLYGDGRPTDVM